VAVLLAGFTALAEKCVQQNGPERGAEELAHALNTYMGDILEGKSRAAGLSDIEPRGSLTVERAVLGRPLLPP